MASTPSASALSAVLRCRGNIWARNPPTKRPVASVYSLGLAGGRVRDSPAERTWLNLGSAWEAFLQRECVVVGRLTVSFKSPQVDGNAQRGNDYKKIKKLNCHPKLSQSSVNVHSAVPGVQNALVRQLARRLTFNLPGMHEFAQMIKYETCATHICKICSVQETSEFPAGVLKVSITSPCLTEHSGQIPSFVLTSWSTLKSTCLSLTALVTELMFLKLVVLCRSSHSPDEAAQHEENTKHDSLQENGQIYSPADISSKDNSGYGQRSAEDTPD